MKILSKTLLEGDWEESYNYVVEIEPYLVAKFCITNTAVQYVVEDDIKALKAYFQLEANDFDYHKIYCKVGEKLHAVKFLGWTLDDKFDSSGLGLAGEIFYFCVDDFIKSKEDKNETKK